MWSISCFEWLSRLQKQDCYFSQNDSFQLLFFLPPVCGHGLRFMHRLRSKVQPNEGFMNALRALEKPFEGGGESGDGEVPQIQEGGGSGPEPELQRGDRKRKPARTVLKSSVKADPNGLRLEIQKVRESSEMHLHFSVSFSFPNGTAAEVDRMFQRSRSSIPSLVQ